MAQGSNQLSRTTRSRINLQLSWIKCLQNSDLFWDRSTWKGLACTQLYFFTTYVGWDTQTKTAMLHLTTTWSFYSSCAPILNTVFFSQQQCSWNASSKHKPPAVLWLTAAIHFPNFAWGPNTPGSPLHWLSSKCRLHRNIRFRGFSLLFPTPSITVINCRTVTITWPGGWKSFLYAWFGVHYQPIF